MPTPLASKSQTTALPGNLQLKAGQFFAAFGRQNQQHPHAWAFVDQPLIMNRVLGGDGLRNVGTQLSWLAPTPFYSELALGVFNGEGGTAFSFRDTDNTYGRTPVDRGLRGPGDLVFAPRASASFDLNDEQTLVLGTSAAFGPNDSGTLTRTVSSGEDAAAGTLDAMALSAVGRSPETMAFWLPEGETIINPDAIAVLKGAPRKELARAFVEFTLSDAGQRLFILRPGQPGGPRRYPLCRLSVVEKLYDAYPADVRSIGAANPFQTGHTIYYDSNLGNKRWDALNDVFGAVILDAHQDLAAAWRAVVTRPIPTERRAELERELFAPICSEEELMTHARNIAEASPRVRTATVNRWGEAARLRYRTIVRSAGG